MTSVICEGEHHDAWALNKIKLQREAADYITLFTITFLLFPRRRDSVGASTLLLKGLYLRSILQCANRVDSGTTSGANKATPMAPKWPY